MQDVRDAQAENGMIDNVALSVWQDFDKVKGSPAWGDVICVIPYDYYLVYGDKDVIRENISAAKRWDSYVVGRRFREKGCNSFNHYAFGSVAEWMFGYVLGIRFDCDGIKIQPIIDESGRIKYASGSYRLDGETVEVSWKNLDNGMTALQLKGGDKVFGNIEE